MTTQEPGWSSGNPVGFIRALQAEGVRPTEGLRLFRDPQTGGKIMDSRWFSLYRQVANTLASTPQTLGLDPYSLPGPSEYETWALGGGNQFMTQVDVTVFDRDLGEFLTKPYTYVTDEPHTIADAEDAALADFDPENTGSDFNQIAMGALATTVAVTVPYGSL